MWDLGIKPQSSARAAGALKPDLSIAPASDMLFLDCEKILFQIQGRCLLSQKAGEKWDHEDSYRRLLRNK